jgi:catechol 2,3-dioxygenase-like lactoylglutathione lyase family enzyme
MQRAAAVRGSVPIVKVSDMQASESFYCTILGFRKLGGYSASAEGPAYLTVSLGSAVLHLSSFPGDGAFGSAVYFEVDDVDSLRGSFRRAGLEKVDLEPTDQTWGRREIYVRDPDGNCLRFGMEVMRTQS